MKKLLTIIFLIASIGYSQVVGAKISAQQSQFDFGKINPGEKVTHDFVINNNGGDTLIITNVRASCGCTAAKPEKNVLLPGESTKINVKFDSYGRKGHQQKFVYVTSNDVANPELRLSFTADIIDVEPAKVEIKGAILLLEEKTHDFGSISEGKVVDYTIKFKNAGIDVLEIKDVKTSCGCTAAVVSGKILKPGETGTLRIEFDSANRVGKVNKTITIQSNDSNNPVQLVSITGEVIKKEN